MIFGLNLKRVCLITGLLFVCYFKDANGLPRSYRTNEICGQYNGYRLYLEQGQSGILEAHNVSIPNNSSNVHNVQLNSYSAECTLELVTCPSCVIKLSLSYVNFPTQCNPQNNKTECQCDHLVLSEPPYDSNSNNKQYCGNDLIYRSKTRTLQIKFVYWSNMSHAFTLEYASEQNRDIVTSLPGNIDDKQGPHNREISSPFFPQYYPRDLTIEHVLTCSVEACRIHVIFTDFQLSIPSTIEFFDSNGERIDVASGTFFRPRIVISTGPSMVVRFSANGGTSLGYKAKVTFTTVYSALDPSLRPITDCGGFVENIGGAITMMKMLSENLTEVTKTYDCIWVIKPPNSYLHLKTHLSLRVDSFELGPNSMLTIRQGTTSDKPILQEIGENYLQASSKSFVVPLLSGFYVHLQSGNFSPDSRLAIVYTAFSYTNCYIGSEFLCKNLRCIPIQLYCDSFDQCGDGSDEPGETCVTEWASEPIDRRWYAHTPNYFFPKIDRYPDLKVTTLVLVMSSVSLVLMISCLLLMIQRNGKRARRERELQNQLQTISELLDGNNNQPRIEEPEEAPPYEAPPDYDEIIKVGMDDQMNIKRERRSGRKSRMNRRRSSATSNTRLTVALPEEGVHLPSTSTLSVNDHLSDVDEPFLRSPNFDRSDFLPSSHILGSYIVAKPYLGASLCECFNYRSAITETTEASENVESINRSCQENTFQASEITPSVFQNAVFYENPNFERSLQYNSDSTAVGCEKFVDRFSRESLDAHFSQQNNSIDRINLAKSPSRTHLWSENSKYHRSWVLFKSEEQIKTIPEATSASLNSVDFEHLKELDDYLLSYPKNNLSDSVESYSSIPECSNYSTSNDLKSCFCSSSQSIISSKFKSSLINKMECQQCKNLILNHEKSNAFCENCIERLYSPKICVACSGRISFQDLKAMNTPPSTLRLALFHGNGNQKLCNCFPKYPSQHFSSIQPTEPKEIQTLPKIIGKCSSFDQLSTSQKPKKLPVKFYSHSCIPINVLSTSSLNDDSSDDDSYDNMKFV